jgi:hypothetical protein
MNGRPDVWLWRKATKAGVTGAGGDQLNPRLIELVPPLDHKRLQLLRRLLEGGGFNRKGPEFSRGCHSGDGFRAA